MKWEPGRQGTGYRKLLLFQGKRSDCYLIDYPPSSYIDPHVDAVPGFNHWRLNVRLWGEDTFVAIAWRRHRHLKPIRLGPFTLFRPDEVRHAVRASSRRRLVLSLGLAVRP